MILRKERNNRKLYYLVIHLIELLFILYSTDYILAIAINYYLMNIIKFLNYYSIKEIY